MTCFIPVSSTNVSISYTVITAIEIQPHLIGVTISKRLQEGFQSDLYERDRPSQTISNFVTKLPDTQHIQVLKF